MLINFRVSNFLSFNELNTFSLEKGKSRRHSNHVYNKQNVKLLKFSAIYGANGAGKSNLIKAFKFSKNLISENEYTNTPMKSYCRTSIDNKDKETQFEYDICIGDEVYSCGFSLVLSKQKISKEWLYLLEKDNSDTPIFLIDRSTNSVVIDASQITSSANDRSRLNIYIDDFTNLLKKNSAPLFINFINDGKNSFSKNSQAICLNEVYNWFAHKLEVITPKDSTNNGLTYLDDDETIEDFLKDFGTGINKVIVTPISLERIYEIEHNHKFVNYVKNDLENNIAELREQEKNILRISAMMRTENNLFIINSDTEDVFTYKLIQFQHYADNETYTLSEESDGTIRLLELYDIIKNNKEKVFIVDELDRSLHPNLTMSFIKKYLSAENSSQLIVSTHEDRILDLDIMRRDEIWFVEKDTKGESSLYSLEEFKTRFDQDIMSAYLDGRYGSIPKFKFLN